MSYCEYHEFKAIDAPLTHAQRQRAAALSSRAHVTSTSASYVYHYSSFRGDPMALIADCFDMMLYMASYGTRQLIFRFPLGLIDEGQVALYEWDDLLTRSKTKKHLILDLHFEDEGGSWIEGEGWLDDLVPLRRELLDGDFRCLYLFWLAYAELRSSWLEDDGDASEGDEPPVPPGLGALSPAQEALVQFLALDPVLVQAAAAKSPDIVAREDEALDLLVHLLPDAEKLDFLQRLSREEPGLSIKLNHRLRMFAESPAALVQEVRAQRSIGELQQASETIKERQRVLAKLAKEKERASYLRGLSGQVDELWEEVDALIQTSQSKHYDKAVSLLVDLHDLAVLDGDEDTFGEWLQELVNDYATRRGLLRRMREAALLD